MWIFEFNSILVYTESTMAAQLHRDTLSHKTKSQIKTKQTTKTNRKTKLTKQKRYIYFYCTNDFEEEDMDVCVPLCASGGKRSIYRNLFFL